MSTRTTKNTVQERIDQVNELIPTASIEMHDTGEKKGNLSLFNYTFEHPYTRRITTVQKTLPEISTHLSDNWETLDELRVLVLERDINNTQALWEETEKEQSKRLEILTEMREEYANVTLRLAEEQEDLS